VLTLGAVRVCQIAVGVGQSTVRVCHSTVGAVRVCHSPMVVCQSAVVMCHSAVGAVRVCQVLWGCSKALWGCVTAVWGLWGLCQGAVGACSFNSVDLFQPQLKDCFKTYLAAVFDSQEAHTSPVMARHGQRPRA